MTKSIKSITGFLGISMFMFGVLKFINPFKEWYTIQVTQSELPFQFLSYWGGQLGEIAVGIAFIFLLTKYKSLSKIDIKWIFYTSNWLIVIMMLAALYVHQHPNVPSDVLPLKIKGPYIPIIFLLIAVLNIHLKSRPQSKSS